MQHAGRVGAVFLYQAISGIGCAQCNRFVVLPGNKITIFGMYADHAFLFVLQQLHAGNDYKRGTQRLNGPLMARYRDMNLEKQWFAEISRVASPLGWHFGRVSIYHFLINSGSNLMVISNGFFMQYSQYSVFQAQACGSRSCACNRDGKQR